MRGTMSLWKGTLALPGRGGSQIFIDVRKIYDDVSKKVPAEKLYEELYSGLLKLSKKN
jgi:hypothetical protein